MTANSDYPRFILDGPLGRALLLPQPVDGEPGPSSCAWIEAASWEGEGALAGSSVRFSRRLNTIVGGNGVGKSTLLESIAFALQATSVSGDPLRRAPRETSHLLIRDSGGNLYVVEKSPRRAPIVRDATSSLVDRPPSELVPGALLVDGDFLSAALGAAPLRRLLGGAGAVEPRREQEIRQLLERNAVVLAYVRERIARARAVMEHAAAGEQAVRERVRSDEFDAFRARMEQSRHREQDAHAARDQVENAGRSLVHLNSAIEEARQAVTRAVAVAPVPILGQAPFDAAAGGLLLASISLQDELGRQVRDSLERLVEEARRARDMIEASHGVINRLVEELHSVERLAAEARLAHDSARSEELLLANEREQLDQERNQLLSAWRQRIEDQAAAMGSRSQGHLRVIVAVDPAGLPEPRMELNSEPAGAPPRWQPVEHASGGTRATAALLIAMETGGGPLLLDQPESMVDSSVAASVLAPAVRGRKETRQIIAVASSPFLPVLAAAEHVIGLEWEVSGSGGRTRIEAANMGPIASPAVRAFLERMFAGARQLYDQPTPSETT